MKKNILICTLLLCVGCKSPHSIFEGIKVPLTIMRILEEGYISEGNELGNATAHIKNYENPQLKLFTDGIYVYKGQGPHFPRKIFIAKKNRIYIFNKNKMFNGNEILSEFETCIQELELSIQESQKYELLLLRYIQEEENWYKQFDNVKYLEKDAK